MKKIIQVMTHPFGTCGARPREVLEGAGCIVRYNPHGRRLKASEVPELIREASGIIAGTELYTPEAIAAASNLRVIARVGAGLDSVDLPACRRRGILVTYTPQAPADAVAELTVAQVLNLLRRVHESDRSVREGTWNRYMGRLLREVKIGILGVGRIGKRVARLLQPFGAKLFGCDIAPDLEFAARVGLTWLALDELFATCDVVSVHLPLTDRTRGIVGKAQLDAMPGGACLINTARGKIVDEDALTAALAAGRLAGAALDVYASEPYDGPLRQFDNVVLTAHIGASARNSRLLMELGAAEDCVRVLRGEKPENPAPEPEAQSGASSARAPAEPHRELMDAGG